MKEYYRVTREDIEKASEEANWGWCAPTAVYLALKMFGIEVEIEDLADEMATTHKYGTDLDEVRRVFWKRGLYTTEASDVSWDELQNTRKNFGGPMLVEWWDDRDYVEHGLCREDAPEIDKKADSHFTLIDSMNSRSITLIDTGFGKKVTLAREWFEERWGNGRKDYVPDKGWVMLVRSK